MRWEGGKKRRRRVLGSKTDFALSLNLFTKYTKYGGITKLVIHLQQRVLGSKTDFSLTLNLFTKYTKYGGITRLVIHLQRNACF